MVTALGVEKDSLSHRFKAVDIGTVTDSTGTVTIGEWRQMMHTTPQALRKKLLAQRRTLRELAQCTQRRCSCAVFGDLSVPRDTISQKSHRAHVRCTDVGVCISPLRGARETT